MRESTDTECFLLKSKSWEALAELRGRMLAELQEKAQRLEATLVLTEDQRDKALKERDDAIAAREIARKHRDDAQRFSESLCNEHIAKWEKTSAAVDAIVAERDAAIAERDAARTELDRLKPELDQQVINREARKPLRDYQRKIVEELYAKSLEAK